MKKYEYWLAILLLSLSTIMKISSVIAICTIHPHHDEVEHDGAYKTKTKKIKSETHKPIY
jgi:hypothetical protein